MTVKILLSARRDFFSALIRLANGSLWSHEAIIDGDYLIEALPLCGVRRVLMSDVLSEYTDYSVLEFDTPDTDAALNFAYDQIGKPYDFGAIFWQIFSRVFLFFGMRRSWQDDSKWFCFELREAVLRAGGLATVVRENSAVLRASDCWQSPLGVLVLRPKTISV